MTSIFYEGNANTKHVIADVDFGVYCEDVCGACSQVQPCF